MIELALYGKHAERILPVVCMRIYIDMYIRQLIIGAILYESEHIYIIIYINLIVAINHYAYLPKILPIGL